MNAAVRIYGLSGVALGLLGLIWGDFASHWQPVPPDTPARSTLAYVAALLFLGGGFALQWHRSIAAGATILALLHLAFALLWARRIVGFPELIGTWSGTAEPAAMALGAVAAYLSARPQGGQGAARTTRIVMLLFGFCLVAFGLAHFLAAPQTAALVPTWIPPGQRFWAFATGLFHLLAGAALSANLHALLASRLLTIMFVGFGLIVWAPRLFLHPELHPAWAGNAINFALIASALAVAHLIARTGSSRAHRERLLKDPLSSAAAAGREG